LDGKKERGTERKKRREEKNIRLLGEKESASKPKRIKIGN